LIEIKNREMEEKKEEQNQNKTCWFFQAPPIEGIVGLKLVKKKDFARKWVVCLFLEVFPPLFIFPLLSPQKII
jgi:hypothetical protein